MSQLWQPSDAGSERSVHHRKEIQKEDCEINFQIYLMMALCHLLQSRLRVLHPTFDENTARGEIYGRKPDQLSI